ncbi:hypothetical protein MTY_2659 [Moorella thermoacetica Y72]|uniref:Uncharacterized protein n=1 Tax=Moorella thermoacetica Y72 TaxID=1325331 RepID=A0A0S6UIM2_NEOTH|nr:hypothetical protein MTY_2659 [Moorella thermoacetica Y72]
MPLSRIKSIAIGKMNMAQCFPRLFQSLVKINLFDIHVKGIQVDLKVKGIKPR